MAGLDDLYAQIPTADIASRLGADEGEVDAAVHTLVPALLSGLHQNSQDPEHAARIESAATAADSDGHQAVATLFGGSDADQVASALAGGGAGNSDLLKQLLPVVLPIVLAYIGKQLSGGSAPQTTQAQSGGLGEVLGSILSGSSGDKSLGGILGSVLSGKGGGLGDILGGLLGGKK
ncbi:hypothetical protein AWC05_13805 [Mycobacterium florentinum]|uniref:DUF937 domain-containing protein n=1 Tax=Mycobacterium florentinum TaxID=292462 RepID=A0A1X1UDR9_MYCFL|nr:DUF937 domain-containing protein [Mycobacterium florentinum]MCV7412072.1 DUF937 domain-containing protein [Mycobacterium florentinum]ORV54954.1 hypothetical protein AWC05_13805 [Mycobacterium florentinum]BBX81443.1 hypothetical protein MFLOJ_52300 [Mycobacterium florentinum]